MMLVDLVLLSLCFIPLGVKGEVDLGDGLSFVTTFMPQECKYQAETGDIIHYHYVGRLGHNGQVFGQSFDYNSPYIVALGHGRIIAGMDRGLMGTCLWERRKITIPPHLGYGERGVGKLIAPNSTLVFYIRLIKIERNGVVLGEEPSLEDLWSVGMEQYTDKNWQNAIDSMEKALELFAQYEEQTRHCLEKCKNTELQLNIREKILVDKFSFKDPLLQQFLTYAAKAQCIDQCKKKNLPRKLRNPDPLVLQKFKTRVPYSYLHYAYYQLENLEEGAKCAFTYYFYNPNDTMIITSISYYRKHLELAQTEFLYREPGMKTHQITYEAARAAYSKDKWLESSDLLEQALEQYETALNDCLLMCEDVVYVNFTQNGFTEEQVVLLEDIEMLPDAMEYYQLLKVIIQNHLKCRTNCHNWMATVNGDYYDRYLPGHFHHLQFSYFKLELLDKAAEAAATFRVLEPSDTTMASNVKYYRGILKVPFDSFNARQEIVNQRNHLETEERILSFIANGNPQKRSGRRGDIAAHEEL